MSTRRRDRTGLRTLATVVAERRTLPRGAFWVAAAIALVAFAANTAASPLYWVYEAELQANVPVVLDRVAVMPATTCSPTPLAPS